MEALGRGEAKQLVGAGAPSQQYTVQHPYPRCQMQRELRQICSGGSVHTLLSCLQSVVRSSWQPVLRIVCTAAVGGYWSCSEIFPKMSSAMFILNR